MNRPEAPRPPPNPTPNRADRWIGRAAGMTVAGLTGIAGAISYSHMRLLAAAHGDADWHAHAFPLSVDGIEIVASLVLLAGRHAGRRSGSPGLRLPSAQPPAWPRISRPPTLARSAGSSPAGRR